MGSLTRQEREQLAVIESEGARIVEIQNRTNHPRVIYTFDGFTHHRTIIARRGIQCRSLQNFRAAIRRNKPQGEP